MASLDQRFLMEIGKVDARSKVKHKGENWRDMSFIYCFKKMMGHLLKWWWAGKGNYNGNGPHHLAKVAWYADKIMYMERECQKKTIEDLVDAVLTDDRPARKTKMGLTFVINLIKTKHGDEKT